MITVTDGVLSTDKWTNHDQHWWAGVAAARSVAAVASTMVSFFDKDTGEFERAVYIPEFLREAAEPLPGGQPDVVCAAGSPRGEVAVVLGGRRTVLFVLKNRAFSASVELEARPRGLAFYAGSVCAAMPQGMVRYQV